MTIEQLFDSIETEFPGAEQISLTAFPARTLRYSLVVDGYCICGERPEHLWDGLVGNKKMTPE